MIPNKLLTAFAIALFVFFTGCKKDTFDEIMGVCPLVISTSPFDGETSVPINKVITATFNEAMNPATITQESFTITGTTPVTGVVTYSGRTASFTPTGNLPINTTFTGRIKTSVKDPMGNALQEDYVWSFSTGLTLSPMVIQTDPTDMETNVLLNKTVTATFNMQMDPLSINSTSFVLTQGSVSVPGTVSHSGAVSYFTPSVNLTPNTVYTGTITTGAQNTTGTSLANDYIWTFTTGTLSAPRVTCHDPQDWATGVVLNKVISACFSERMDPSSLNNTSFTLYHGGTQVAGTVHYIDTFAYFTPAVDLLPGTYYTATITTDARNLAGTSLLSNSVWNFTTLSSTGPASVDLKSAEDFGILSGLGISSTGFSVINDMNVGISPGVRSSVVGFPPATVVNGAIFASDDISPPGVAAMLTLAKQDLTDAYLFARDAISPAPVTVSGDQGGQTLAPGIYKSTSTLLIQSGDLTLDAQGDVNAVWIFQIASDFTTVGGAGGSVILTGGAQAKNVYWQTGSSAIIGDYTSFKGNVLALTSITLNSNATVVGRLLARNGAVVLTSTNIINKP